jgi:hypothetical protein
MSTCLAGAIAGPSDNDFKIDDFQVTSGEDYYIVVSSWLSNTIGYTLDIIPFDCANLPAPDGPATQDFVAGDTVSTLEANPTETGATLIWYAQASDIPANPITGDPALVNGEDYFVTQLFNGCESPPLVITVNEIDCSTLGITATTGDSTSCKGILTLTATSSGTGNDIYWFNAATGGNIVGTGATFTTPVLTTTTSYWAAEVTTTSGGGGGGPLPTYCTPVFTSTGCSGFGDDIDDFTLTNSSGTKIIEHLGTGCSTNSYADYTTDPSLTGVVVPGNTYNFETSHHGTGGKEMSIWIDFDKDGTFAHPGELVYEAASGSGSLNNTGSFTLPASASGEIVMRVLAAYSGPAAGPCNTNELWGEVHDYKLIAGSIVCESPRMQATATVNQTGDVTLDYNDLSYTDTANTSNFSDKFSGDPGTGCDGAGILDGGDVVYQYTADPNNDDILDIELTGISNPNTGMYIYASCGDVGINCLAGGTNENALDILIDDYYVTAGTEIFIVISSSAGSTNYTLNINGIDCANVAAPTVSSTNLYFVSGDMLDTLESEVVFNQYGTLTWYSALPPTAANEIDPATTPIVDGTTYYVTQTILGCESAPLAITPAEFQCGNMKIDTITPDFSLCAPGGNVTLNAQGTGIGNYVYWYDAQTGGNILFTGNSYSPNVATTTSFWVSEVYISSGGGQMTGQGMVTGSGDTDNPNLGNGLVFDAAQQFTLVSVDIYNEHPSPQTADVQLWASGSSSPLQVKNVSMPAGNGTSGGPSTPTTVQLNFLVPPGTGYRLVLDNISSTPGDFLQNPGNFPYPLGPGGSVGQISSGVLSSGNTSSTYYHFYNWTISTGTVVCESARTEVTVTINDQPTAAPTGTTTQKLCEGNTLADIAVAGTDIQWYSTPTGGSPLGMATVLQDGDIYYASQTVDACESDTRLEVTVFILPIAPMPTGASNQYYFDGEHISDLDVTGTDLVWYEDEDMTQEITDPTTFDLENYETYYVTQSPAGSCESEPLAVTVHEELGTTDPLFAGLTYHPNPMKHKLSISNTTPMESVSLYDLRGRKIMQRQVNGTEINLDVSNLQAGAYFLRVNIDGKTGVFKLVKE